MHLLFTIWMCALDTRARPSTLGVRAEVTELRELEDVANFEANFEAISNLHSESTDFERRGNSSLAEDWQLRMVGILRQQQGTYGVRIL